MTKPVLYLALALIALSSCSEKQTPKLYATIAGIEVDDFVYTNNGYLLIFSNYDNDESNFTLLLKSENQDAVAQPVFPISRRDTLFASNLIYALIEKEGESWLLFDKTADKKSNQKKYKLSKHDFLRRATEKSYTILPIIGRDLSNAKDLQIDEKRGVMIYFDKERNDFVAINLKDGTFKSFLFPQKTLNPVVTSLTGITQPKTDTATFKLVLNKNNATLYLINLQNGELYSVHENYLIGKQFFSKDIQTQIILVESGLDNVVDIEFDERNRPIIATDKSIYLIRNNDKAVILNNFKYGDISSISYSNGKIFFNAKTKKNNIFYIELTK